VSSVEEVKLHVAEAVEVANQAVTGIQLVVNQLDESLSRLRLTAVGSAHPSVLTAMAQLDQAKSRLDEATTLIRTATDAANTYRMIV
jgi:hypothetical protein